MKTSDVGPCLQVQTRWLEARRAHRDPPEADERHLESCQTCRKVYAAFCAHDASLAEAGLTEVAAKRLDRALESIAEAAATRQHKPLRVARWSVGLACLASATAVLVGLWWWPQPPGPPPPEPSLTAALTDVVGDVRLAGTPAPHRTLVLTAGQRITVGPTGRAELRVAETKLVLGPQSEARLIGLSPEVARLEFQQGQLAIEPLPSTPTRVALQIDTPAAQVRTVMARVAILMEASRATIIVDVGTVAVTTSAGSVIQVAAGTTLTLPLPPMPVAPTAQATDANHRRALTTLFGATRPLPDEPTPSQAAAPTSMSQPSAATPKLPAPATSLLATELQAGRCDSVWQSLQRSQGSVATNLFTEFGLDVGQCFEHRRDLAQALQVYTATAARLEHTSVGQDAAYETGRVAQALGRSDVADRAFANYLAFEPAGPLAPEAHYRRCQLAVGREQIDAALTCARDYHRRFPNSRYSRDMWLLEAEVRRQHHGDCAGAMPLYQRYIDAHGPHREEAQQWLRWCATQAR